MTSLVNLRTKCRDEFVKIDPNSKVWSADVLDSYINRGYTQTQKDGNYQWRENQASTTATSVSGTQEYSLPSDFIRLKLLRYNGDQLEKVDYMSLLIENSTMPTGKPYQYYLYGGNYGLYPTPNDAQTIDIYYLKLLPTITTSQASALPDPFDDAICEFAKYAAFLSVQKQPQAQLALADYNFMIQTLMTSYINEDENIKFGYQRMGGSMRNDVLYR
tara:strand:- start:3410 stop:4060 length:651 start_codon:yes stop_codon:yes gene_type:complete